MFSFDYEELLNEVRADLQQGLIDPNGHLKIVRNDISVNEYYPIIDFYYDNDPTSEPFEWMTVADLLKEMEYMDTIIK